MIKIVIILIFWVIILLYNIFFSDYLIQENFDNIFLHTIVDKIYVINMDKDKGRMHNLDEKMRELKLDYQRITGVDGQKVYPEYKKKTKLRPGQIGCLLSHLNILNDAIKNKYENILVLEDDILFHRNFHNEFKKKYNKLMKNEKNYDLIYLGCHQSLNGDGYWSRIKMKEEYYENNTTDGTFAMLINKNIFQDIINFVENLELPIDTAISKYILSNKKYKTYSFFPHLIISDVSLLSNTDSRQRDMQKYIKFNKIDIKNFNLPGNTNY